jgi:hypothetical protein
MEKFLVEDNLSQNQLAKCGMRNGGRAEWDGGGCVPTLLALSSRLSCPLPPG